MSKPLKIFLWIFGVCAGMFVLLIVSVTIVSVANPEFFTTPTPTPSPTPRTTPTRTPVPPTPTPIVMTMDEYQELVKTRTAVASAKTAESITATARRRAGRQNITGGQSSVRVLLSVESRNFLPGSASIRLSAGTYTVSKTVGCVLAELARLPSDDLVVSLDDSYARTVRVSSGSYILRATGRSNCTATLRR